MDRINGVWNGTARFGSNWPGSADVHDGFFLELDDSKRYRLVYSFAGPDEVEIKYCESWNTSPLGGEERWRDAGGCRSTGEDANPHTHRFAGSKNFFRAKRKTGPEDGDWRDLPPLRGSVDAPHDNAELTFGSGSTPAGRVRIEVIEQDPGE